MDAKPQRRWFRFRISTVLILIAIVAWAMACWPWAAVSKRIILATAADIDPAISFTKVLFSRTTPNNGPLVEETWIEPNTAAAYPALALAAFLAWKAAWAVVERRRNWRATA
ncbi:MAG: hypothetical protein AB7U73_16855 [Pirellulales bacterium]